MPPQELTDVGLVWIERQRLLPERNRAGLVLADFEDERRQGLAPEGCGTKSDGTFVGRQGSLEIPRASPGSTHHSPERGGVREPVEPRLQDLSRLAFGAAAPKDMGKVMALLKERYAGQMDFGKASGLVKELLK